MIEKLYEQGLLDYNKLIIRNYKALDLNPVDVLVLIKILDIYKTSKKIRTSKIISETGLTKREVEESMTSLMEKNIYSIYLEYKNGIGDESISLKPFFEKVEKLFEDTESVDDSEISLTIKLIEGEIKRPLTPIEFNVISEWFSIDGYNYEEIKKAVIESVKMNRVTFKNIEKELLAAKKQSMTLSSKMTSQKANALDKIYEMIK